MKLFAAIAIVLLFGSMATAQCFMESRTMVPVVTGYEVSEETRDVMVWRQVKEQRKVQIRRPVFEMRETCTQCQVAAPAVEVRTVVRRQPTYVLRRAWFRPAFVTEQVAVPTGYYLIR